MPKFAYHTIKHSINDNSKAYLLRDGWDNTGKSVAEMLTSVLDGQVLVSHTTVVVHDAGTPFLMHSVVTVPALAVVSCAAHMDHV